MSQNLYTIIVKTILKKLVVGTLAVLLMAVVSDVESLLMVIVKGLRPLTLFGISKPKLDAVLIYIRILLNLSSS